MHEMSLCQGVLKILQEQAEIQNYSRVNSVTLEVGELSTAVPESMEMCFDAITRGTLADGAELIIVRTRGEARGRKCEDLAPGKERFGSWSQGDGVAI